MAVGGTEITRPARRRGRAGDRRRACARWAPSIERSGDGGWRVAASASAASPSPTDVLDLGNSGTAARLLLGILASHPFTAFVTGDASLRARPMAPGDRAAGRMGASFVSREGGRLPLAVSGADRTGADRLPPAGALGPGEVGGAAGRAQRAGRHHGDRAASRPATTPSACCAISAPTVSTRADEGGGRRVIASTGQPELAGRAGRRAGRPVLGRLPAGGGADRAGLRRDDRDVGLNPLRTGLYRHPARDGRRHRLREPRARRAASRSADLASAPAR